MFPEKYVATKAKTEEGRQGQPDEGTGTCLPSSAQKL